MSPFDLGPGLIGGPPSPTPEGAIVAKSLAPAAAPVQSGVDKALGDMANQMHPVKSQKVASPGKGYSRSVNRPKHSAL